MPIVGICQGAKRLMSAGLKRGLCDSRRRHSDASLHLRLRLRSGQPECAGVASRMGAYYQSEDLQESPEDEADGEKDCHDEWLVCDALWWVIGKPRGGRAGQRQQRFSWVLRFPDRGGGGERERGVVQRMQRGRGIDRFAQRRMTSSWVYSGRWSHKWPMRVDRNRTRTTAGA